MHTPWAFEPKDRTKAKPAWAVDENKKPFENKDYDMLETWDAICRQGFYSFEFNPISWAICNFYVNYVRLMLLM